MLMEALSIHPAAETHSLLHRTPSSAVKTPRPAFLRISHHPPSQVVSLRVSALPPHLPSDADEGNASGLASQPQEVCIIPFPLLSYTLLSSMYCLVLFYPTQFMGICSFIGKLIFCSYRSIKFYTLLSYMCYVVLGCFSLASSSNLCVLHYTDTVHGKFYDL